MRVKKSRITRIHHWPWAYIFCCSLMFVRFYLLRARPRGFCTIRERNKSRLREGKTQVAICPEFHNRADKYLWFHSREKMHTRPFTCKALSLNQSNNKIYVGVNKIVKVCWLTAFLLSQNVDQGCASFLVRLFFITSHDNTLQSAHKEIVENLGLRACNSTILSAFYQPT